MALSFDSPKPLVPAQSISSQYKVVKGVSRIERPDAIDVSAASVYSVNYGQLMQGEYDDRKFKTATKIDLPISIPNMFVLGGTQYSLLGKLFKSIPFTEDVHIISRQDIEPLATGKKVLYNRDGAIEVVDPGSEVMYEQYSSNKCLIGGDAIRFILQNVYNVEQEIRDMIQEQCIDAVSANMSRKDMKAYGYLWTDDDGQSHYNDVVEISKGDGAEWVIDDYYVTPIGAGADYISTTWFSGISRKLILDGKDKSTVFPRFSLLLTFRDNKAKFIRSILRSLYVLPIGFRPSMRDRQDPLTNKYNVVYGLTKDLSDAISINGSTIGEVRSRYHSLVRGYFELTYAKGRFDPVAYKTILDLLKGKKGVIRGNVGSSTIDYSGRAVITVDPNMSVDTIGIPIGMAVKLMEPFIYKYIVDYDRVRPNDFTKEISKSAVRKLAAKLLEGSYCVSGRQPSLHLLSIEGFIVKVVEGTSIVMSPATVKAFNADFDGDQMHVSVPISEMAKLEVKNIMANVNNVFLPKDGTCHIGPRQDMIYGLFMAYNATPDNKPVRYSTEDFINIAISDLVAHKVKINNPAVVNGRSYPTLGRAIVYESMHDKALISDIVIGVTPITFKSRVSKGVSVEEKCPSEKWYKELLSYIRVNHGADLFIEVVNNLVRVGFAVASLYPPDISMLHDFDFSDMIHEFHSSIEEREKLYCLGFDTEESYSLFYSDKVEALKSKVLSNIRGTLGPDNGFVKFVDSGARGDNSNLMQIFGMKGTILKNRTETFNTLVEHSHAKALSGLEHFISAYGSRTGIIDKVIGTSEPGYIARRMSHVSRHLFIRTEDCHTDQGLDITYDSMLKAYGDDRVTGNDVYDYENVRAYTCKILTGRYVVGCDQVLTSDMASELFNSKVATRKRGPDGNYYVERLEGLKLRSPLTCPACCCSKCYGTDLMTHNDAVVGTPVGFIAAQAIGEPVSQSIMKNFQGGGVKGGKNITSSLSVIEKLLELNPLAQAGEPIYHDMISPVSGDIVLIPQGDGTSMLQIRQNGKNVLKTKVRVYDSVKYKSHVQRGETIQLYPGYKDTNEVYSILGIDAAISHLLFTTYNMYESSVGIDLKHFEILVNGMVLMVCTKSSDDGVFKVGHAYSLSEYYLGYHPNCGAKFEKIIRGLKRVPRMRDDFLTALYLEDVRDAAQRNFFMSGKDDLKDPLVRITMGMDPGIGTAYDTNYIINRRCGK